MTHERTTLHPAKRFDWERIVRRVRLDSQHVTPLMPKRVHKTGRHAGALVLDRPISATVVKGVGLALASYANRDGSSIYPGVEKLALVLETTPKSVVQALAVLRAVGLIECVKRGNKARSESDEYRLTIPEDLLDVLPILDTQERQLS